MEARQISVQLRRDPREIAERHSQANPLTLSCTLARGETVEQNLSLYAELHASRTPASVPLAASGPVAMTTGGTGPWELDFTSAQMNQTVLPGEDVEFWLVVYAISATEIFTLGTIRLTLQYDNISQVTPAPPEPALSFSFGQIAVAGQSPIVADSAGDTLTIAAGSGIVLTTTPGTDTLTIAAIGGTGSGDVAGPASATDNAITRFDGTTGKIIQNSSATLSDQGGITADTLAISTTPTGAGGTGVFRYDTGEKVPEVGIDGITLKIGVQEYVRVYNAEAVTLTKGQVVYISGAQGNRVAVRLADASVEATSAGTLGLVAQSITAGSEGFVQVSGPMYNLTTTGLTAGALLYLSETAGQWTQTEPPAPAHGVRIGYVQRVDATVGSIFIKVDNGYELGELHNVSDSANNITAFLVKNSSTNIWTSRTATEARSDLQLGTLATQSGTFSGTSSGTNTGDVTLSGTGYLSLAGQALTASAINLASHVTGDLPLANLAQAPDPSVLLGRRSTGAGDYEPITLGTNLSMSGTVLNATGGGSISDGDKGDITVSGSGATWTIDAGVVSYAKFQDTVANSVIARVGTTTGSVSAVTLSASQLLGRGATGDVAAITLGTNLSMSGTTLNATGGGGISDGDKGDITVSGSGETWTIDNGAVTYAKMQAVSAASRLLGRGTAGTTAVREIALGSGLAMSGDTLAARADVQIFDANGTWNNPSPSSPRPVLVRLIGAGGGGGGGRCDVAGTPRSGGGGGGSAGMVELWLDSLYLGSTESVTVGAGGTSGAGATTQGNNGADGGDGGSTTFAGLVAVGGLKGGGGTASTGAGAAAQSSCTVLHHQALVGGGAGGAGNVGAAGSNSTVSTYIPCGGAGGGGLDTSNAQRAGGSGGGPGSISIYKFPSGSAGALGGGNGGTGTGIPLFGGGGGGGGSNATGAGGNGGAGGPYGGGGGGGGAGLTAEETAVSAAEVLPSSLHTFKMDNYAEIIGAKITNVVRWDGVTPWTPPDGATIMLLSAAIAAGYPYATRIPTVPDSVQPVQLRTWLLYAGKLDQVDALIDGIPDPMQRAEAKQRWDYTLTIPRTHPMVLMIGQALGMTSTEMDDAFIQAATM